ncbi:FkbM family methyltransferase [Chloroflexota bacterium]
MGSLPQWVEITGGPLNGCHMLLDLNSPAYWQREMKEGRYDAFIYEEFLKLGSISGVTVWDVGAHIGYHSLAFAALVGPSGRVVAFEPNPHNCERFRMNSERNPDLTGRITLMTSALSNVDGECSFIYSPEVDDGRSTGSHMEEALVPESEASYITFDQTRVPTVKADTLLSEKRMPSPSIMKIDVEGAEKLVLEGAVELLTTLKPLLFIEVHNIMMMFNVQKLLNNLGYQIEVLNSEHSSLSRCFIVARHQNS